MLDTADKIATGFDASIHVRCPSDLMPAVHAHARQRGLTASSWVRMVLLEALERGSASPGHAGAVE